MFRFANEVSHEWLRRATVREYRAGKIRREDICDADFLLKAAGRHHGTDSPRPCPVCESSMRDVLWVYGDNLGRRSGSARTSDEIARLIDEVGPFSVHRVEVCDNCGWNHLLSTATAVGQDAPVT